MTGDAPLDLLGGTHVVLLRPRWARNLGSVARAMKNFGLSRLTLVDSRIGSWSDAWVMAVQADSVLRAAVQSDDLDATLAGASWVVGTTNTPPAGTRVLTPREVAREALERGPPALLFGGEISGLDAKELLRCHVVSAIPTAPEQSSLNLAHAVCIYAAELFCEARGGAAPVPVTELAPTGMLQRVEQALAALLENSAWSKADRPKNAIAHLMQPLYRAGLTDAEAHAWLTALNKAAQPNDGSGDRSDGARRP
jgi:TrmH family RNA methyltransferase